MLIDVPACLVADLSSLDLSDRFVDGHEYIEDADFDSFEDLFSKVSAVTDE